MPGVNGTNLALAERRGSIFLRRDNPLSQAYTREIRKHARTSTSATFNSSDFIQFMVGAVICESTRPSPDLGFKSDGEIAVLILVEGWITTSEHHTHDSIQVETQQAQQSTVMGSNRPGQSPYAQKQVQYHAEGPVVALKRVTTTDASSVKGAPTCRRLRLPLTQTPMRPTIAASQHPCVPVPHIEVEHLRRHIAILAGNDTAMRVRRGWDGGGQESASMDPVFRFEQRCD